MSILSDFAIVWANLFAEYSICKYFYIYFILEVGCMGLTFDFPVIPQCEMNLAVIYRQVFRIKLLFISQG